MRNAIHKLRGGRSKGGYDYGLLQIGIGEGQSGVELARLHELPRALLTKRRTAIR